MSGALPLVRLIDDDPDLLAAQAQALRIAGFRTESFGDGASALEGLGAGYEGVILSDVRMPGIDGLELHRRVRAIDPELPVTLLTGHGDVAMAVAAIREGAWDFLTKPVGSDQLAAALRRAAQARALVLENRDLRRRAASTPEPGQLLAASPAMLHLRESAQRLGEAGVDVLILGPEGAGKEALARAIYYGGPRRGRGLLHLPCELLEPERFDLEFLGVEAGLPGAPRHARLPGRIEKAHRGTLLLDRVELLAPEMQGRILNLIEQREVLARGAAAPRPLDMQVIATSREDLGTLVAAGRFRADLYYRLSGVSLTVPPLSARPEDVPLLFRHFLLAACARLGLPVPALGPLAQARLATHRWPGGARELRQFAEAQVLGLEPGPGLGAAEGGISGTGPEAQGFTAMMAGYEAGLLREVLQLTGGHAGQAMARLKLPRKTFYDKLARHGLRPADYRS